MKNRVEKIQKQLQARRISKHQVKKIKFFSKSRKWEFSSKTWKCWNEEFARIATKKQQQVKKINIIKQQVDDKTKTEIFACKRCSIKYFNNIQFHKHIDEHYIKKIKFEIFITSIFALIFSITQDYKVITSSFSSFSIQTSTSLSSKKSLKTSISITSSITSLTSLKITWTTIIIKLIHMILFSTSSSNSSQTSILKYHESRSKFYMIIDDLFVMFVEKRFKKSLNIIQKKMFSFVFRQIRIINYFKLICRAKINSFKFDVFTINLNSTSNKLTSINQIIKTSQIANFASKRFVFKTHCTFYICRLCHEAFVFNNNLH